MIKSDFYEAFVTSHRGVFNVRDRAVHSRKRKMVSNAFSLQSIMSFEPYIHHNFEKFVKQWDRMSLEGKNDPSGYYNMDAVHWFNFLAFDVISDLAFGKPFGMLEKGADIAETRQSPDDPVKYVPAIEMVNRRGEVSNAIGYYIAMKPWAKYLPDPFFSSGMESIKLLYGIAGASVAARLKAQSEGKVDRDDLLARLIAGKDENGQPLSFGELTSEIQTHLVAGSDTASNTACAIVFHVLNNPRVIPILQAELDAAIPDSVDAANYDMVKDLVYLDAIVREGMRVHSTARAGLMREVPPGPGLDVNGVHFPPGTILSIPAGLIHHSKEIWGPDADQFRPERFIGDNWTERQKKAFIPFSAGPRACLGRNLGKMELVLTTAMIFRRYDIKLRQEGFTSREGFLMKPDSLHVGIRLRQGVTPVV